MNYAFVEALRREIEDNKVRISAAMADGSMKSYDEYRHYTGIVKGLDTTAMLINDLMIAYERKDNE